METESRFTEQEKKYIAERIVQMWEKSGLSQEKFANTIGFKKSDISNLSRQAWVTNDSLLGEQKWIRLAQKADFRRNTELVLRKAPTKVFDHMYALLEICHQGSTCTLMCDAAGIGKTYTCRQYAADHPGVLYIDCSQCSRPNKFKQAFSAAAGLSAGRNIDETFDAAILAVSLRYRPMIILDEAGDLDDGVFRLIKRIYNRTKDVCGIFMTGADGLKSRIERGRVCKKPGFAEIFSRFTCNYGRYTPDPDISGREVRDAFMRDEMQVVLQTNGIAQAKAEALADRFCGEDLRSTERVIKVMCMNNIQ